MGLLLISMSTCFWPLLLSISDLFRGENKDTPPLTPLDRGELVAFPQNGEKGCVSKIPSIKRGLRGV